MGWMIDTHTIPKIRTWDEAKRVFEATVPWKDTHDSERALGLRREKHKIIIRDGTDYKLRLYQTDVVIYHQDGDVTINAYSSVSTTKFIDQVAPVHFSQSLLGGTFITVSDSSRVAMYRPNKRGGIRFTVGKDKRWVPLNPGDIHTEERLVPNLSEMGKVRKQLKTYFTWSDVMDRLQPGKDLGSGYTTEGKEEVLKALLENPEDPSLFGDVRKHVVSGYYNGYKEHKKHVRAVAYKAAGCYTKTPITPYEVGASIRSLNHEF